MFPLLRSTQEGLDCQILRAIRDPDDISPLHKQLPITVLFAAAIIMSASISTLTVGGLYSTIVFVLAAAIVNELASRARRRLKSSRAETAAASEELDRAAQIQQYLLPKEAAPLPGYEIVGARIPSKAVGGDFYDWYEIDGGLGFTLGDVMGKGAGAGMIAATARAVIRRAKNSQDPAIALHLTSGHGLTLATHQGRYNLGEAHFPRIARWAAP